MSDKTILSASDEAFHYDRRFVITWSISKFSIYILNYKFEDVIYEFIEINLNQC